MKNEASVRNVFQNEKKILMYALLHLEQTEANIAKQSFFIDDFSCKVVDFLTERIIVFELASDI